MKYSRLNILLLLTVFTGAWAQNAQTQAYLGYAYPAGGCVGESFEVLLGGRYLNEPQEVIVSGEGVQVKVLQRYPPQRNINGTQKALLRMRIAQRQQELSGKAIPGWIQKAYDKLTEAEIKKETMPANPTFDGIETKDERALKELSRILEEYNARQQNAQIGELVKVEIMIDKEAPPGMREIRIFSKSGLSNPIRFHISRLPELHEEESNDDTEVYSTHSIVETYPAVMNGQIMPGDVDRFILRIPKAQTVSFDLLARRLIPYVADAVPGWFQATLALYDAEGKRLAYVDDTYGDPDPQLDYNFTSGGVYILEVRDAIYRGCENFVYRLLISDTSIKENIFRQPDINYEVKDLPMVKEIEPNDTLHGARMLEFAQVISGAIDAPGDIDLYPFHGIKGDTVIVKIEARYLDSPLDSLIRILSPQGEMLAYNDDYVEKREHLHMGPGLMTHYADSYLAYQLPETGRYTIVIEDAQRNGGADYKYRLRVSRPIPDFEVRMTPSTLNIGATGCAAFKLYLKRMDGFDGEVELRLVDPPEGARLTPARIAADQNEVWSTLEWPVFERYAQHTLQIEAVAQSDQGELRHPVVATDDSMQAFLWRHLLPAQELKVASVSSYHPFAFSQPEANAAPIQLARGNQAVHTTQLAKTIKTPERFEFRLKESPNGLELIQSKIEDNTIHFEFNCTEELDVEAASGNLIIEVSESGKNKNNKKRYTRVIGELPAVPYRIETP